MGTRADFYVGRGKQAEWIGSIAWDGYPDGIPQNILQATSEVVYRKAVEQKLIADGGSATHVSDGWSWPWDTSETTDYTYAFDHEQTWISYYGEPWQTYYEHVSAGSDDRQYIMPTMKVKDTVDLDQRSGLIIIERKN